jgi:hypothetical protein
MKKLHRTVIALGLISFIAGCTSVPTPRKVYTGAERSKEQISRFFMAGKGSFSAVLYKVDGKTCSDPDALRHTFLGPWMGFNVLLLPGTHEFELVILKDEYAENISFVMEAGADYELLQDGAAFSVYKKTNDEYGAVAVKRGRLSFYQEPEKSSAHGILAQDEATEKDGSFAIYRIDGMPGKATEALQASNLFVALGDYEIRLSPGKHVIEYSCGMNGFYTRTVSSKEVTIEAGKKYRMRIVKLDGVEKGIVMAETELANY